jgi:Domain of unknown function (DUF1707)/Transcriptional regulator PadR-like family
VPTRALQEATLLVLASLAYGSQHGPGIIADVQRISGGRVKLRVGTLYTALDRLLADGLVAVDREEIVASRPRRFYRLITPVPSPRDGTSGSDLRIGDADREATAAALREHFAQGRLTSDELLARLDVAFTATMRSEISRTTRDLPQL